MKYGVIEPPKLCEEKLHIYLICHRAGSTIALKSGQLGVSTDTLMPMFSADGLGFAVAI